MLQSAQYVKEHIPYLEGPMFSGPLFVILHFRFPGPESWNKAKRMKFNGIPHFIRPDGDNLEKFINDALNGILWKDDAIICWMLRSKTITFSKEGSTTIFVRELTENATDYKLLMQDIYENIKAEEEDGPTE